MDVITYAILDSEGRCINITLWDGKSDWRPPDGCTVVPNESGEYQIQSEDSGVQPIDYLGFYGGLLTSNVYRNMLMQPATAELAMALAIFVSAIQDCLAGRENREAMQGAIWMLLSQLQLDPAHVAELGGLMTQYNLANVYSLSPSPDDPSTPDVNEAWVPQ